MRPRYTLFFALVASASVNVACAPTRLDRRATTDASQAVSEPARNETASPSGDAPLPERRAIGTAPGDTTATSGRLPRWLKIAYTLFLAVIVPLWLVKHGPANFLWFSDIAMLAAGAALWLENALLASTMAVGVLLPEALWNVSFFGRLLTGRRIIGLADYMFEPEKSRLVRGLSLVLHVAVPIVLLALVARLGYDERAWTFQTLLAWVVLPLTYLLTDPAKNINWVFGPGSRPQRRLPPLAYLALLMLVFPAGVYLPTHLLLTAIFTHH